MITIRPVVLPVLAGALTAACAVGEATGSSGDAQLRFNVAAAASGANGAAEGLAASAAPLTLTDGTSTLVIEKVEIVLRDVELERTDTSAACPDDRGIDGDDDDVCEKLTRGPILLDLPLGTGGPAATVTVPVDTGHFDEIEFEVHKPSDDTAEDRAFLQAHPDFDDVSIRVTGTFDGTPFTFVTDRNFEQEIELSPPLVVGEQTMVDLTLAVDVSTWFRDGAGRLIDPATAGADGENDDVVEENIERSFEAFGDEDRDGRDDRGSGDDDGDDD